MSTRTPARPTYPSRQLRASTRAEHARAEAAVGVHEWTVDLASYGGLLTALQAFYGPAEETSTPRGPGRAEPLTTSLGWLYAPQEATR